MNTATDRIIKLPPEQQAIRAKCFHPSGEFEEFPMEDVEKSIPERFEKIVRLYPERVAVKTIAEVVTYAELNARANRFARKILLELGRSAEPVALLFEKGVGQIAAMLGVLKAGKCFALLDPSFPRATLEAVLDDVQATMLVADCPNVSLARQLVTGGRGIVNFDSIDTGISVDDLQLPVASHDMAFVVHTSGSTGRPKGVIQTHRTLLHRAMLLTNADHLCMRDKITLLSTASSNFIGNVFFALLNGAALLPFDVKDKGVNSLAAWLFKEKISICLIGSPLFRRLCEALTGIETFHDLRFLRLRSEMVYKTDVDLYRRFFPPTCVLANGLSSSETGMLREYLIDHDTEILGDEVPLGYALDDKDISLLDEEGREVGFNNVGEIVVRSRYLSPGYLRQPELTEAKFKADPDGSDKRVYFTGDLGLMRPDGCLIYKGRKDFRVKIRGYGVELAAVENVLREHSVVRDVVVVAREDRSGESRVISYLISAAQAIPNVIDLRSYLRERLPEYMIPSAFVFLESMPLTPNGKVDRRALPQPDNSRAELDTPFIAPRTPIERQLAEIWVEVLCLDRVGIHDNFFDLGGHSLTATRIVSQVIKKFQLEVPLQSLFQSPTVAEMAAVITEQQTKKLNTEELHRILTELETLSDEEAQRLLARETPH